MPGTKENILHTALRLFARDGYEAVSVSAVSGELGMTKGALYKHYKNKRDIFDSIVERIYQMDDERAQQFEVPAEVFEKAPLPYHHTSVDNIDAFIKAQFRFWTEDEFGCNFRRMITLEQYRNPDMAELYQKCLAGGPVDYMEDLFREMIEQGALSKSNPKQLALEFYAPFHLLLSIYDVSADKEKGAKLLAAHIERFMQKNTAKMNKEKEQSQ
ncbi:TetR/AcrR family transcriptional regulator [Paenibacillus sp. HW567]|uniref:TetR/AcrR family transcriptional regulator n=1 Tax=Paenibacillus sp. HW567 TaxID=1034769 RepID=UPI000362DE56|nr:TetR/AcrR family transcriptional regulator [Paenibacillus sp. HW567]